jgi:hypothetical protein
VGFPGLVLGLPLLVARVRHGVSHGDYSTHPTKIPCKTFVFIALPQVNRRNPGITFGITLAFPTVYHWFNPWVSFGVSFGCPFGDSLGNSFGFSMVWRRLGHWLGVGPTQFLCPTNAVYMPTHVFPTVYRRITNGNPRNPSYNCRIPSYWSSFLATRLATQRFTSAGNQRRTRGSAPGNPVGKPRSGPRVLGDMVLYSTITPQIRCLP